MNGPGDAQQADGVADAFRRSEHRAGQLYELVPIPQLVTTPAGTIVEANDFAAALLGLERRFLRSKPLSSFVPSAARRAFRLELSAVTEAGSGRLRFRVQTRGEGDREVEAAIAVDPDGEREELFWILHDVTAQLQAEMELRLLNRELEDRVDVRTVELASVNEELALEQARFAAVFRQMPSGLLIADAPSGRIVLANAHALALFGEEVLEARVGSDGGGPFRASSHKGSVVAAGDLPLARAMRGETVIGELIDVARDSQRPMVLEVSAAPVRNPRGDIVAAVAAFNDVTAREQRERIEREFVQNAAHQLRTPLAAITSAVAVLQAGASEDPVARRKFLDHIARESDRLARLTRSLLVLARAQTAQEAPELEEVELGALLRRVADTLDVMPEVEVEVRCNDGIAALANRDLAEEALASIADNAARYTTRGTIELRCRRAGPRRVVVEVSDTGPGIPAGLREHVFERFARGSVDASRGFGLGLAIASQAVAAMGGSLDIDSEPGKGTTARLTLQAARDTA
jgi:PAS domain S-box-containing protein